MIGSVYDYYLTTYASKPATKSDTHKKAELKNVYSKIVNISKKSPLYKINVSADLQKYVIDLKENSRYLLNDINDISFNSDNTVSNNYFSDNENIISINQLISSTSDDNSNLIDSYDIEIKELALPQVNTGNCLRDDYLDFSLGEHCFEITINNTTYELQFDINDNDTNSFVLQRVERLINQSDIGLSAKILHLADNSALEIISNSIGLNNLSDKDSSCIFKISKNAENSSDDILDVLGIDNISTKPQNARFYINGVENFSSDNSFIIENSLKIMFKNITTDNSIVKISRKNNIDSVIDSINELITEYNNIIEISKDTANDNSLRLNRELKATILHHKNSVESVGISINEDGFLDFDEAIIIQSFNDKSFKKTINNLSSFKDVLTKKLNDITINPMKYVNKIMISYPNPIKSFANPYLTSIYSGMMYNNYI